MSGISATDKTICIDISHVSGVYIASWAVHRTRDVLAPASANQVIAHIRKVKDSHARAELRACVVDEVPRKLFMQEKLYVVPGKSKSGIYFLVNFPGNSGCMV